MGRNTERARGFGALVRKMVTALGLQEVRRDRGVEWRRIGAVYQRRVKPCRCRRLPVVDPEGRPTGYI